MQNSPGGSGRKGLSSSPAASKKASDGTSPASQYVRGSGGTLGVASPTTRHSSMPGVAEGKPARQSFSKKRLDPSDPTTWTSSHKASFSGRPRATSETIPREDVPAIKLQGDTEKSQGNHNVGADLGGSTVVQDQKPSPDAKIPEPTTASSQIAADPSPSESQKSHTTSTADPASPETKSLSPSSPKGSGLAVPKDDSPDNRRFSNQSASFSSVNTDSDRVGRTSYEDDADNEHVLQESSDERSSSTGSSDEGEEDNESLTGERGRKRKSDRGSKSPERRAEESPKESASPVIRVQDMSDPKQEHPHPPDDSGKLSETKPNNVAPKSGVRRAPSPAALSATGDDDAELRRAKELVVKTSPIDETVKDRSVKMIIRGEWESFQDIDDEETAFRHEPRLYLVCSDLSSEASHALEWTVGTLLKDGDTLLIISAIEDENAPKHKPDEEPSAEIKQESVKAAQQAGAIMESLTKQTTNREGTKQELLNNKLASLKEDARSQSRGSRSRPNSRRGHDRVQAIEKLEQDFMKFVRKTTLQVRTMIEVLHCRSSRHLILNAIDELEPTLVVVGTRGQSSIQGVMMGSFSNYLVTKSSIPVMVARRRLKKPHHAKISSQQIRLTNNLIPFGVKPKRKSLTQARID